MRKLVTLLLLAILFSDSIGQSSDFKWSIGLFGGKTEYKGDLGNGFFNFKYLYGLGGLSINRYLSHSFDLGIQGEKGRYGYYIRDLTQFLSRKTDGSLLLKYKFNNGYLLNEDAVFAPYLAAGVGLAGYSGTLTNTKGVDGILPLGGGLKINLTDAVAFQIEALYFLTTKDNRDLVEGGKNDRFMTNTMGLVFSLGAGKDTDGDGVPDKIDKCPGTPSGVSVNESGCPGDSDNDGVPDYIDKCPTVKGLPALGGCPDSDGDGIQDSQDNCPDVKGLASLYGCPDTDGDGIKDSDDKCPNVKGVAQFAGCPDTDGDGIQDSEDRCPNVKGPKELKGCPDSDNDGIADIDDRCPTIFGIAENKGCPAIKEETKKVFDQALRGILFETGKDVIKPASFPILDNIVTIMKENPEYNLEINGHTDAVGDDAKNLDLSKRRAGAVVKYLSDKGVEATRMMSNGFGETLPVGDNNTVAGRALNRRVEFKVNF